MSALDSLTPEDRAALLAQARAEVTASAAPAAPSGLDIVRPDTYQPAPAEVPVPDVAPVRRETVDEKVDRLLAERESAEVEDFGAFWAAQGGGKRIGNVCGRDLQLPRSVPLRLEMEQQRLKDSKDPKAAAYLFDILFGDGVWDDLVERGIDAEQLPVLLLWGMFNVVPDQHMSLDKARVEYARMSAEKAEGKDPTPPALAATGGATSAATGT